MKDPVKKERKRQKSEHQRIQRWTKLANQIPKDELFLYRFVKKTTINEKEAIQFLHSISIKIQPEMVNARKKKIREHKLHKEKKKQLKKAEECNLPDIPWLDDDSTDARYQMEHTWMQLFLQSAGSENKVNSCKKKQINEDDLPF